MPDGVRLSDAGGPTIRLRSGHYFDLANPEGQPVLIEDVAHALSNLCRFTGHSSEFYSVAEHSVLTSFLVPPEDALAALLHDAPEAFYGDDSRPKKQVMGPEYRAFCARIDRVVHAAFGLPEVLPAPVKQADLIMLKYEQRVVMGAAEDAWGGLADVPDIPAWALDQGLAVSFWEPKVARFAFLRRFEQIRGQA